MQRLSSGMPVPATSKRPSYTNGDNFQYDPKAKKRPPRFPVLAKFVLLLLACFGVWTWIMPLTTRKSYSLSSKQAELLGISTKTSISPDFLLAADGISKEAENIHDDSLEAWSRAAKSVPKHCLPSILAVGPPKTGTTDMYSRVKKGIHPNLWTSLKRKELGLLQGMDALERRLRETKNSSSPMHNRVGTYWPPWMHTSLDSTSSEESRRSMLVKGFVNQFPFSHTVTGCTAPDSESFIEITPLHSTMPYASGLSKALLPDARIVFTLRNPVKRLISHFGMWFPLYVPRCNYTENRMGYLGELRRNYGGDPELHKQQLELFQKAWVRALEEAVDSEIAVYETHCPAKSNVKDAKCDWWIWLDEKGMLDLKWFDPSKGETKCKKLHTVMAPPISMAAYGLYAAHVSAWLRRYPPNQVIMVASEDFKTDADEIMAGLAATIGLDPKLGRDFSKAKLSLSHINTDEVTTDENGKVSTRVTIYQNKGEGQLYDPSWVPQSLIEKLEKFYEPHNEMLYQVLSNAGYNDFSVRLRKLWSSKK